MKKQGFNEIIKKFSQSKTYQFLAAFLISVGIIFVSYHYLIEKIHVKRVSIEKRITSTNLEQLKKEIKTLKVQKQDLVKSYKIEQESFQKLESKIYKTHYIVITDILDKINTYAFNIHSYKLNEEFTRMDVNLEGSYQNLIRFIDFLGSVPATVIVKDYKITLSSDNMMVIVLGIEVAPIRI